MRDVCVRVSKGALGRLWVTLLAVLTLVAGAVFAVAAPASAGTATTVTGTAAIQGQVLGWNDPLAYATVTVYSSHTGQALKSVKADVGGEYHITGLPAVQVKVRAAKSGWLPGWADEASSWSAARVFTLYAGKTLTQSWSPVSLLLDLTPEAAIQGQVLGWMDPVGPATVTVFNADTGRVIRSVKTDDSGNYRVGGLAAGRIKVRATMAGWLPGWADGVNTWAAAHVFTLEAGQTITQSWSPAPSLYLDLTPPASLSGNVLGLNNDPSGNGWDGPLGGVTVRVVDVATGKVVGSAQTNSLGDFTVNNLYGGAVKILACKSGWLTTTELFTVQSGAPNSLPFQIVMYSKPAIRGQVLADFDPIGYATVTVFDAHTGKALKSVVTDANGNYRIDGLPVTKIKVRATKAGWLPSWADGAFSWSTARVFTLEAGQTYTQSWSPEFLYLDLTRPTTIEGSVLGINNDQWGYGWDDPLGGVTVTVFDATGKVVGTTRTDSGAVQSELLGHWSVGGLYAGQVTIRFSAPGWLTKYVSLTLQEGLTNSTGEIVMYSKPAIRGQVLANFDPIGYATVTVFDAHTGKVLKSVVTDADGNYRIDGLPVTKIKVRATKAGWLPSWANGKNCWSKADVLTLTPGNTLSQGWDPMVLYLDLGLKS